MTVSKNKVDAFLEASRIMIINTSDPEIKPELENYGYDEARLQALRTLYKRWRPCKRPRKKSTANSLRPPPN